MRAPASPRSGPLTRRSGARRLSSGPIADSRKPIGKWGTRTIRSGPFGSLNGPGCDVSDLRALFGRRDAFLYERIPLVTVWALPQELGRSVAAAQADVWIQIENRVARQVDVPVDKRGRQG